MKIYVKLYTWIKFLFAEFYTILKYLHIFTL